MSISPVEYLRHILDETDFLTNRFARVSKEDFLTDETLKRAAVRSLEIIGEAVKKLPDDFRNRYIAVDWRAIAGMRDRLQRGPNLNKLTPDAPAAPVGQEADARRIVLTRPPSR
ncbi:MAG: HepT-like ribonuclease domain-containing protein [Acidobacteriota bacterium]